MRNRRHSGQSLLEYVVLLALVTIVAISLVVGLGQRSSERVAKASDAISEASVASATAPGGKGKPNGVGPGGNGNGNGNSNGNGYNQPKKRFFGD